MLGELCSSMSEKLHTSLASQPIWQNCIDLLCTLLLQLGAAVLTLCNGFVAATIVPLVLLLRRFLCNADGNRNHKPMAFIATTLRNEETLRQFLRQAEGSQLIVDDISAQARQMGVNFQHHAALETQRNNIFMHKIVLCDDITSLTSPA